MNGNNNSPYFTGVAPEPNHDQGDVNSQLEAGKMEGERAKQTAVLPNPMDKIDPMLSEVFVTMIDIKGMIDQVGGNPAVNKKNLRVIQKKIDEINKSILDLPNYFATISL